MELSKQGYTAYKIGGYYNGTYPHAWVVVEIPIEATSGQVIPIQHYRELYTEEERQLFGSNGTWKESCLVTDFGCSYKKVVVDG